MGLFRRMKMRRAREAAMRKFRNDVRHDPGMPGVPGTGQWRNPGAMLIQDRPNGRQWERAIYQQVLDEQGVDRNDMFITAALKSEMPHDRSVEYEIAVWRPYLEREIEIVRPYCLLVVGKLARRVIQDVKGIHRHGRTVYTT